MYANNEIGTIHPIAEIGKIAKEKGVIFHCDATQGVGKVPVDVEACGIDLLSLSAHKIYGPKGIGALYVRSKAPRVRLTPTIDGGGHERGMRSGTLNVPGIVGLGAACEIAGNEMPSETARLLDLRDKLQAGLFERLDEIYLNGHPTERLPGNLNVSFAYVEGESLLMGINDIAVSSGSACTSATLEPSYVIRALGVDEELAHSSIRFGLGRFNTEEEVDYVADRVSQGGEAAARHVAALRDGKGRNRPQVSGMAPRLRDFSNVGEISWRTRRKLSTIIQTPATWAAFPRTNPTSAPAMVGAPECGDVMKLQLKINDDRGYRGRALQDLRLRQRDREFELRYRIGQGQALGRGDGDQEHRIVKELNLPPVKIHCSVLAEDAIKAAISDWRKRKSPAADETRKTVAKG